MGTDALVIAGAVYAGGAYLVAAWLWDWAADVSRDAQFTCVVAAFVVWPIILAAVALVMAYRGSRDLVNHARRTDDRYHQADEKLSELDPEFAQELGITEEAT